MRILIYAVTLFVVSCTDPDLATYIADCNSYAEVWKENCKQCLGRDDDFCEALGWARVTGGRESCVGLRPQASVEDFWSNCVHQVTAHSQKCDVSADSAVEIIDEEENLLVLGDECRLEYDPDLATGQEEAGLGS